MANHYMTENERYQLEALRHAGMSVAAIAKQLGFCRQTIYNELRRGAYVHTCMWNDEIRYSADKAQQLHNWNQTAKGRPLKIGKDRAYADFLERKVVKDRYSPAAALAAARAAGYTTTICAATFYSYITKGVFLHLTRKHLWVESKPKKRRKDPVQRIVHTKLPSIEIRPETISQRSERGHWEMDLVVSCEGSKSALLTMTERMTREEIIIRLPDKRAETIRRAMDRLERSMTRRKFREKFKSITTDKGPEFLEHDLLIRSVYGGQRFTVYYCHSYAAWEKGSVENSNGMIRRFFPKGTDFSKVSLRQVKAVQDWMNNYPRKSLGWLTPLEVAA